MKGQRSTPGSDGASPYQEFRAKFVKPVRFFIQHVVRYALRHKVLGVINILSIALGVSTYLAVQIANRSATAAFQAGIDVVAGRANVEVRGTLDDRLFPELQKLAGITAATPLVERIVTLPDWPGEYLHILGVDPFTNSTFDDFKISNAEGEINKDLPRAEWLVNFTDKGENALVETIVTYKSLSDLEQVIQMGMEQGMMATLKKLDELLLAINK